MRVLVIGGEGQLGRALRSVFAGTFDAEVTSWDLPEFDMTQAAITEQIAEHRPDLVINAGAWTDVDGAESNVKAAYAVNALGPKLLADGCKRCGAPLVQISTNEVFAGESGIFYHEYDVPHPRSAYARSKAAGERAVQDTLAEHYIVRIAWLYGEGGNHFPSKIIEAADRLGTLKVVDDEFGNPTYAQDVAHAVHELVESGRFGIYHLVNEGYANRYELARAVLEGSGRADISLERIKVADWPRPAPPPLHAVLVNQLAAALGIRMRPWQEALNAYLEKEADRFVRT